MAAAAAAKRLDFWSMSWAELRQWVEANPERVKYRDRHGNTALIMAAISELLEEEYEGLSLVMIVWLLDEKGADVNATDSEGKTALHEASSLNIVTALLDRGADPSLPDSRGKVPLMWRAHSRAADVVARLLQDPRVRITINVQDKRGRTALHAGCMCGKPDAAALNVHSLLQAGTNPTIANDNGQTPLAYTRQYLPHLHAVIALLEQTPDAEKASLLVKARRFAVAANSNTGVPSYLHARLAQGHPLPAVALAPLTDGQTEGEEEEEKEEVNRKLRTSLAFLTGLGREAMPAILFQDIFMKLLMPSWDPLMHKNAGTGPPVPQG